MTARTNQLELIGLQGIPMVAAGDSVGKLVYAALQRQEVQLQANDILVIAQKIISKAEGRMVRLADITPSAEALQLSEATGKEPKLAELIVQESVAMVRTKPGVAIVEHRLGLVHANAGVDQSNIAHGLGDDDYALLLPNDPDASAAQLRDTMATLTGVALGVIISDSIGRPWRLGTVPVAIGAAGLTVLDDQVGEQDLFGRQLQVTVMALGDQIAAAAGILMGETTAACPAVVVRGIKAAGNQNARHLLRPKNEDMFR